MKMIHNATRRVRRRIERVFTKEGRAPFFSIETLLLAFSLLYGAAMRLRAGMYYNGWLSSQSLPCHVVSIGNIVVGGTGKTPMTIWMAQQLRDRGHRIVVISRGYGGTLEKTGGIVSDGEKIYQGPAEAGDEPHLMARLLQGIPVIVGSCRYKAGLTAIAHFHPDVILLDDAFQHLRLSRSLNFSLLDYRSPFGNGYILPRGRLREPISALDRADAIIFTRTPVQTDALQPNRLVNRRPVFFSYHMPVIRKNCRNNDFFLPTTEDLSCLSGKRIVVFAGLADNDQFFSSLKEAGAQLVRTLSFSDHHRYDGSDLNHIDNTAKQCQAEAMVTSVKDFVKIENRISWTAKLVVVDVQIRFCDPSNTILPFIESHLS